MSFLLIERSSDALVWQAIVPLEGVEYLFSFYWSTRESILYLSIYNQNEEPLALWMALLVNVAPLRRFRSSPLIPPGVLIVSDTTGQGREIAAPEEFGERVILGYITSDDPALEGVALVGRA
jgi:hypothetical protein